MTKLRIVKCPCGDKICSDYFVSGFTPVRQGAGYKIDEAREIAESLSTVYPEKYQWIDKP